MLLAITFSSKHCAVNEMSKNVAETGATNDITIWRIRLACWISEATRVHAHARVHAPRHPLARTRARAYGQIYLILFHGNNDSKTRLSVALYVHYLSC